MAKKDDTWIWIVGGIALVGAAALFLPGILTSLAGGTPKRNVGADIQEAIGVWTGGGAAPAAPPPTAAYGYY